MKSFRDTPATRKFARQLQGEKSVILAQIKKIEKSREQTLAEKSLRRNQANRQRSEKMKRTWRYIKAIQKNYPTNMTLKEIRTALRKHRMGLENDIPDVAWKNPSP